MPKEVKFNYEVKGAPEKTIEIPLARLRDTTPLVGNPAAVDSQTDGRELTGMVIAVDSVMAVLDCTPGNVYACDVDNITTYTAGAPTAFKGLEPGDAVYYDRSTDLNTGTTGTYLSLSPLDENGNANPLFGFVVPMRGETTFTKGTTTRSTQNAAIMIVGAGGGHA